MTTMLSSLPQFLRFLSSLPSADGMLAALTHGPLAPCGATRATFLATEGDEVVTICANGFTPHQVARYARFPTNLDLPSTRALTGISRTRVEGLLDDFPVLLLDASYWRRLISENGPGDVVAFPIWNGRQTLGVVSVLTSESAGPSPLTDEIATALGAALGLWWSHPLTPRDRVTVIEDEDVLILSDRQKTILGLVDQGQSTAKIARELGYSDSTVKQEIQRCMQVLRVADRRLAATKARELGLL